MITFTFFATLMVVLALLLIASALRRGNSAQQNKRIDHNIAIARERLVELEEERREKLIDDAVFEQARLELERVLAGDLATATETRNIHQHGGWLTFILLAIVVPIFTFGMYLTLGSPQHMLVSGPGAGDIQNAEGEPPSVEEMAAVLAKRMEQEPNNPEGWFMLGRTYTHLGRYDEAVQAYEKVVTLIGEEPSVLLAIADTLAMSNDGTLAGRPAALIQKALELAPDNTTALWMVGMVAEEAGRYQEAIDHWMGLLPQLDPDSDEAHQLRTIIIDTLPNLTPEVAQAIEAELVNASTMPPAAITVRVVLAPEVATQALPTDTVFVYARAMEGVRMPLAVTRMQVKDLPAEVTLDDSLAMTPQLRLSSFDLVRLSALVSRSGQAATQSGDLTGDADNIATRDADPIELIISRQVP